MAAEKYRVTIEYYNRPIVVEAETFDTEGEFVSFFRTVAGTLVAVATWHADQVREIRLLSDVEGGS